MKNFSNRYIYIYSIVLVIIVATILAGVAVLLKPFQQKNINAETMQMLLSSAGIQVERNAAEKNYAKYFTKEITVDAQGNIVDEYIDGKQTKGSRTTFQSKYQSTIQSLQIRCRSKIASIHMC